MAPGRLEFTFANPSAKRVPLLGINVPDHYEIKLQLGAGFRLRHVQEAIADMLRCHAHHVAASLRSAE